MPLVPNVVEQLVLLRLNQGPAALLDLFGAGAFRVALSAVKLGLFDALAQGPLTAEELAERIGMHERAATTLLATLEAFGYVKQTRRGSYANTALTAKWLLGTSPSHLADFLAWWQQLVFKFWDEYFEQVMRDGRPPRTIYEWLESQPDGWKVAQAGFEATARLIVEDVVARIDLPPGSTRVLDVGGGHGLYSIELCRRHPEPTVAIFDLARPEERPNWLFSILVLSRAIRRNLLGCDDACGNGNSRCRTIAIHKSALSRWGCLGWVCTWWAAFSLDRPP